MFVLHSHTPKKKKKYKNKEPLGSDDKIGQANCANNSWQHFLNLGSIIVSVTDHSRPTDRPNNRSVCAGIHYHHHQHYSVLPAQVSVLRSNRLLSSNGENMCKPIECLIKTTFRRLQIVLVAIAIQFVAHAHVGAATVPSPANANIGSSGGGGGGGNSGVANSLFAEQEKGNFQNLNRSNSICSAEVTHTHASCGVHTCDKLCVHHTRRVPKHSTWKIHTQINNYEYWFHFQSINPILWNEIKRNNIIVLSINIDVSNCFHCLPCHLPRTKPANIELYIWITNLVVVFFHFSLSFIG